MDITLIGITLQAAERGNVPWFMWLIWSFGLVIGAMAIWEAIHK